MTLDDELVAEAQRVTGIQERSALLGEALSRLVEREAARRLAALGGAYPTTDAPPRRRPE